MPASVHCTCFSPNQLHGFLKISFFIQISDLYRLSNKSTI